MAAPFEEQSQKLSSKAGCSDTDPGSLAQPNAIMSSFFAVQYLECFKPPRAALVPWLLVSGSSVARRLCRIGSQKSFKHPAMIRHFEVQKLMYDDLSPE
jgi:hypothetical protein